MHPFGSKLVQARPFGSKIIQGKVFGSKGKPVRKVQPMDQDKERKSDLER
jgi:hypothetical protein